MALLKPDMADRSYYCKLNRSGTNWKFKGYTCFWALW